MGCYKRCTQILEAMSGINAMEKNYVSKHRMYCLCILDTPVNLALPIADNKLSFYNLRIISNDTIRKNVNKHRRITNTQVSFQHKLLFSC